MDERSTLGLCDQRGRSHMVQVKVFYNAHHNDMYDGGAEELKSEIAAQIIRFIPKLRASR